MIVTYTEQVDKAGIAFSYYAATDTPFHWRIEIPFNTTSKWGGIVCTNNYSGGAGRIREFTGETPIDVHNKIVKYITELGATLSEVQTVHGIQKLRDAK